MQARRTPPLQGVALRRERRLLRLGAGGTDFDLAIEQGTPGHRNRQLVIAAVDERLGERSHHVDIGRVERHTDAAFHQRQRPLADEVGLEPEQRIQFLGAPRDAGSGVVHAEQLDEEPARCGVIRTIRSERSTAERDASGSF